MHDTATRIDTHLRTLVRDAGHRPPGSPANRRATEYVRTVLEAAGLDVDVTPISARWWSPGRAHLIIDGQRVAIDPPPFCRSASVAGHAVRIDAAADLDHVDPGAVLVLRDDLAQPLFPKAFPFLQLPEQVALIGALEATRPAAVLAVRPPGATQPVFEDPDLAFPYATVPEEAAARFVDAAHVGLEVEATILTGEALNVAAGTFSGPRTVVSAHVDSKVETPGALDNATGVAVLLALAQSGLADLGPVELVFFNGEDHYAAPGEQAWLTRRDLGEIELAVNIDGPGLAGYPAAVSALASNEELEAAIRRAAESLPGIEAGDPWFESDHAVFAMRGIPSVAITTGASFDLLKRLAHAADDSPDRIDRLVLADVVQFVRALLGSKVVLAPR